MRRGEWLGPNGRMLLEYRLSWRRGEASDECYWNTSCGWGIHTETRRGEWLGSYGEFLLEFRLCWRQGEWLGSGSWVLPEYKLWLRNTCRDEERREPRPRWRSVAGIPVVLETRRSGCLGSDSWVYYNTSYDCGIHAETGWDERLGSGSWVLLQYNLWKVESRGEQLSAWGIRFQMRWGEWLRH